jgi:hypothetical protein
MHLARSRVDARLTVPDDSAIFPASLLQLVHDLHVLFGNVIAEVMRAFGVDSGAPGCAVKISCHDVPAIRPFVR